ncbi:MAG: hypothetical protein JW737_04665, partial [Acidobacteria bacterium]|nr:hypothetical protein [Acidobacteriota bacterium]
MVKKIIISFCILSILILATGLAEEKETKQPVLFGESITIQSKILNEDRIVYIALPSGYEESNNHYPVLYRLDGSVDSFLAMAGLVKYLEWTLTPPMIVVAIPNTNRGRDMSVGPHDQLPGGPGGENFLKFIVDELVPYINKNFRTTSLNLITGGSAAGKFSTWAMIKHPEIFKIAISGSPAYGGYSWESMKHDTEDAYKNNKLSGNLLFISFFDRDFTISSNDALRYIDLIGQMDKEKIDYIVRVQKGDKHVTP